MKHITVPVPLDYHIHVKVEAAKRGITQAKYVYGLIENDFKEKSAVQEKSAEQEGG